MMKPFFKNIPNNWPIGADGLNELWVIWGISSFTNYVCIISTKINTIYLDLGCEFGLQTIEDLAIMRLYSVTRSSRWSNKF